MYERFFDFVNQVLNEKDRLITTKRFLVHHFIKSF